MRRLALLAGILLAGACAPARVEVRPSGPAPEARREAVLTFNRSLEYLSGARANYFEAVKLLQRAVELDPELAEAHFTLALLSERGSDFARSEAEYRAVLRLRPGDRPASLNLSALYLRLGRHDEARRILEELLDKNPTDHEARNNLAVILRVRRDYERAIEQARIVLDHEPRQVLAYNNLATIFSEQGRHAMAEDLFQRALTLSPDDPRVLNNLGLARLKASKIQEALELFQRAASRKPYLEEAVLNEAVVHLDSGDFAGAAAAFRQAAERIPGLLPALVGQAVAARQMGEVENAEKSYQQILGLDRTHPESLFNLGILYMQYRQKPAWACEAFQRYLDSGRTEPELVQRVRGYLDDLRLKHPKDCPGAGNAPGGSK
ncbi:MAG: tetratricopeptide repeat protein [Myxococcales bacterium]|nr:tetratricopeptide repeat protein [Myxococcales bacterium]